MDFRERPDIPAALKEGMAPNCFAFLRGSFVDFVADTSLTVSFPVLEEYLNPSLTMQGGLIAAAFDNVFGPLSVAVAGRATTLDMTVNYHRPIMAGDELMITARVVSRGRTMLSMAAEAVNRDGKLVATSTSNWMILSSR